MSKEKARISYARLSRSKGQDIGEPVSITAQHAANTRKAAEDGTPITLYIEDIGYTGANEKRPGLKKLKTLIEAGGVETVYVHRYDRLFRNADLQRQFERFCAKHGSAIVSITEPFSGNRSDEVLMRGMVGLMNEHLLAVYAEQVAKVLKHKAALGEYTGGTIPFGYKLEGKFLAPEPKESKVVQYVYERYAAGVSIDTLQRELRSLGYMTRAGKTFSKAALYDMLKQPAYVGKRVYNRRAALPKDEPGNSHAYKPESEWIIAGCDALVSEDLAKQVKARLEAHNVGKGRAAHAYPLTGLLICGEDELGSHMTGVANRGRRYYRCCCKENHGTCNLRDLNADSLEPMLWRMLLEVFCRRDVLEGITKAVNTLALKKLDYEGVTSALNAQLRNRIRARDNLLDNLERGVVETAGVSARLKVIEEDLAAIESELERVKAAANAPVYSAEDVREALQKLPQAMNTLRYIGEGRVLLRSLIQKIVVTNNDITIQWVDWSDPVSKGCNK